MSYEPGQLSWRQRLINRPLSLEWARRHDAELPSRTAPETCVVALYLDIVGTRYGCPKRWGPYYDSVHVTLRPVVDGKVVFLPGCGGWND